ncbi:MATE family efflux transporter [Bacteroidales bacterium OttesenSCG-928-I21]|nr:MATE family efflux transporter [Bacteroidales bacterium OttesenSCG-928-I21]
MVKKSSSNVSFVELGTEKIGKLLAQYAIPAIVAMTASSIYHITDSIFIGQGVGELAISGLAITFPLMNLASAFGSLVGVGGATLMSVRLGQKDYETANKILGNVLMLNFIIGVGFSIIALLLLDHLLYFFGASETTLPYAREFMSVILLGNVVTHLYLGLNALLRSVGTPKKAMMATIFSVIINLILNPLFIFGFKWGIRGSALATVISQILVLSWQLWIFSNQKNFIRIQKKIFRFDRKIVLDSFAIGMSPFLMNVAASMIAILINNGLVRHGGDLAVGAYGIVNRIAFLFTMIVLGLNNGMQPIAGYNYGAKQISRVNEVLKKTIFFATCVMLIGFTFVELFPEFIASWFTKSQEQIDIAAVGLRITFMFFPIVGFQMVTSTFFQSIGMAGKAVFLSLTRQVIFLTPCLLILPNLFGISGIWMSLPISDLMSTILTAIMLIIHFKQIKNKPLKQI